MRALLESGASSSARTLLGSTALHISCQYGHAVVALMFLASGCSVDSPASNDDELDWQPIHSSALGGSETTTALLLSGGTSLEAVTLERCPSSDPRSSPLIRKTPLFLACEHGHLALAQFLLS